MNSVFNLKAQLAEGLPIFGDHKQGVDFVDIDGLLMNPTLYKRVESEIAGYLTNEGIDHIVLPDARGFFFAGLGANMGIPVQQLRKKGKLPGDVITLPLVDREYDAKNGDELQMRAYDLSGKKVAIIDDVLATGGTALTAVELIKQLGGEPKLFVALCEVDGLSGREKLNESGVNVESLITVSELKQLKAELGYPAVQSKKTVNQRAIP